MSEKETMDAMRKEIDRLKQTRVEEKSEYDKRREQMKAEIQRL